MSKYINVYVREFKIVVHIHFFSSLNKMFYAKYNYLY